MKVQGRKKVALFTGLGVVLIVAIIGISTAVTRRQETPQPVPTKVAVGTPTVQATPITGTVTSYERIPGAVKSQITVKANGQDIFVEKYKDISYARFAFSGQIKLDVSTPGGNGYQISPRSYNIQSSRNGNVQTLTLTKPEKLILQAGGEKLFIFADAPEEHAPTLKDSDVIDVTSYVKDTSGKSVQTAQIQKALDKASTSNGIVYFPRGKYVTGTLKIGSNSSVYLSSGALIIGTGRIQDYKDTSFILFDNAVNAKLYGRGVIDLRGKTLRSSPNGQSEGRVKLIRAINGQNLEIQDLVIRDSGSWTVHILGTDTVNISNLKLINDVTNTNGDGIDPDGASNVTVDGAFIYTTDDCFALKTSGNFDVHKALSNVTVKNAVCYTKKSALKVGTETRADLSKILFENNNVVHADRAIALYLYDGSTMQDVTYRNNYSEVIGGDSKQRLIDISIRDRKGLGNMKGVRIINYVAYEQSPRNSMIEGADGHPANIAFTNLLIAGKLRTNAVDARITVSSGRATFAKDPPTVPQVVWKN